VLEDAEAAEVIAEASRLGMDALVEAHDEAEVRRASALGAQLIGINNRDLKTLKVDLAVTERLSQLVPADRLVSRSRALLAGPTSSASRRTPMPSWSAPP
jgi:indole-3-glycerol phosphate synthase